MALSNLSGWNNETAPAAACGQKGKTVKESGHLKIKILKKVTERFT